MTYIVKSRDAEGKVASTLCDTPDHALEILKDQRTRGKDAWAEDADGRPVTEAFLGEKSGGWG